MQPEYGTGRYRLGEPLAPDSNAFHAEDLEDPGRHVVVKVLPETADAIAARHLTESMAEVDAQYLNLPVDQGETRDGRPFLVYPYVDGYTLRDLLNSTGPLPFRRAAALIGQIAAGLDQLHERRIVYGVLAPEHVIVQHAGGRDVVKLLNVGLWKVTSETTASPGYRAPEQLAGRATHYSDIFSLGALAVEIITGRRAFRYGSMSELERMHRRGIPRGSLRKLRPKMPERVEEELRRALAWDPMQRRSEASVLASKLSDSLGRPSLLPGRRLILAGALGVALLVTAQRRCGYSRSSR